MHNWSLNRTLFLGVICCYLMSGIIPQADAQGDNQSLLFRTSSASMADLNNGNLPTNLRTTFENEGFSLSAEATVLSLESGSRWLITDTANKKAYIVIREGNQLQVHKPQTSQSNPDRISGLLKSVLAALTLLILFGIVIGLLVANARFRNRILGLQAKTETKASKTATDESKTAVSESKAETERWRVIGELIKYPEALPPGTVRAFLAKVIVIFSLSFIVLTVFIPFEFPSELVAVLGTVLGFYFGNRSSAKDGDKALQDQIEEVRAQRESEREAKEEMSLKLASAVEENKASQAGILGETATLIDKVKDTVALTRLLAPALPQNVREGYEKIAAKVEEGVGAVERISEVAKVAEKVAEVTKLSEIAKAGNPLHDVVTKGLKSFGRVLTGSPIAPIGLMAAVAGISAKLIDGAYDKWKARILDLPYSPAVTALKVADANTAMFLFTSSPIFRTRFANQLGNRASRLQLMERFLKEDTETLWKDLGQSQFESREEFEEGLKEFHQAAVGMDLNESIKDSEVNPEVLDRVGGYAPAISAIDKINKDEEAQKDLDTFVTIINELKNKKKDVESIFGNVEKEVLS